MAPSKPRTPRPPGVRTTAPSLNKTVPDTGGSTAAPVDRSACLVVIKGDLVGRKFDLDKELSVGRDANAGVCLDDGLVSRNHARFVPDSAGVRVEDLLSTNGTFVNEEQTKGCYLDDGDQITIGRTIFKFISRNNIEAAFHEHVYSLTHFDSLTGVHNRPSFDSALANSVAKAARAQSQLALFLFDIDHFKRCNDTYGHRAGDYVLSQVGRLVGEHMRAGDFAARYGGEEFALILRGLVPPAPTRFADHIRNLVEVQRFEFEGKYIPVTISGGVAEWEPGMVGAQLVELADQRLYRAKQAGRNCIIAY